ncbi:hypothetical protein B0H10DRAFT_1944195 [Mycena sp. CBHHK59/15]|nr:hypothetical protein B0H10DRAFT_1944195 [Mycena sp. CBHHK59/15]
MSVPPSTRAPARQAAKKASIKFGSQLMSSPAAQDETGTAAGAKRARGRAKKDQVASSSKHSVTLPKAGAKPLAGSRKRPISTESRKSDDGHSDLTSLSTGSPTPASQRLQPDSAEAWDIRELTYVWVLLDSQGRVDEDGFAERIWWPGLVTATAPKVSSLSVKLYGKIGNGSVTVKAAHAGNVLPLVTSKEAIRFTTPCHVMSLDLTSPKKRQKLDKSGLERRWYVALSEVVHDVQENEMPSILFLNSVRGVRALAASSPEPADSVRAQHKGKGKAPAKDEPPDAESLRWSPPPPDSSLTIPGELVLAHDAKRNKTIYWPARILEYLPPAKPGLPGRYAIQWIDLTQCALPRTAFFAYEDAGFGTCKLGRFESVFDDVVNDDDDDGPEAPWLSPEPRDPPPDGDAFADLPVHEQFVYAKPVLQAILRGEYPPARTVHDRFIGGGQGRNAVAKEAGERGTMNPRDVEAFHKCVVEWCMRGEGKVDARRFDEADGEEEPMEQAVTNGGLEAKGAAVEPPELHDDIGLHDADTAEGTLVNSHHKEPATDAQMPPSGDEAHPVEAEVLVDAKDVSVGEPAADVDLPDAKADDGRDVGSAVREASPAASSPPSVVAEKDRHRDLQAEMSIASEYEDSALQLQESICAPSSPAATMVAETPSSPAPPPPSSSFSPFDDVPIEMEDMDVEDEFPEVVVKESPPDKINAGPAPADNEPWSVFDTSSTLSEASDISDLVPPVKPPRQIGCEAYEGLSTVEKYDYCLNVLLPELLVQIFVWRAGERRSVALLSPEEERALHELGQEKKKETDWVFDVKRLRAQKEREIRNSEMVVGGTASRPKKVSRQ